MGKEYGSPFGIIEVRGASSSPAELAQIKYVSDGVVLEAEQDWVPTNEKIARNLCPERGIIFCDELPASLPAVQSTLQRLFLDRKLGNLTLAEGWYVVAAGNRAKDKSASGNLSRAFQNRCMMITVVPDPDVFFDWGLEYGIDHRVLSFVRWRPECVNDGLEVHKGENQAFCSPRSLHIASDVLAESGGYPETLISELMTGTLGDGRGSEFNGFLRVMNDLPDLDQILKNPEEYPVPTKVDVAWATIGALSNRVEDKKNLVPVMKYFVRLPTELSVVAVKDLAKREKAVYHTEQFIKWADNNINFAV